MCSFVIVSKIHNMNILTPSLIKVHNTKQQIGKVFIYYINDLIFPGLPIVHHVFSCSLSKHFHYSELCNCHGNIDLGSLMFFRVLVNIFGRIFCLKLYIPCDPEDDLDSCQCR